MFEFISISEKSDVFTKTNRLTCTQDFDVFIHLTHLSSKKMKMGLLFFI